MGIDNNAAILEGPNFSLQHKDITQTSKPETKPKASKTKSNEVSEIYTCKPSVFEFSDEHLFTNQLTIDVRESVIMSNGSWNTDLSKRIRSEFRYLTATDNLEIGSDRTNEIQKYIDSYLAQPDKANKEQCAKWKDKIRVVIANKCESPNAFAYPEGTIIINQSIINLTKSFDELMAVVGHEVGHLLNETVANEYKSKSDTRGVGWLHETAADSLSPDFLDKIGFNPTAAIALFTHISEVDKNKRGDSEHQSSLMRNVGILNKLSVRNYENTRKTLTDLPDGFKKEFQSTNIGTVNHLLKEIETLKKKQELITKNDSERNHLADLIEQKNEIVSNGVDFLYPSDLMKLFNIREDEDYSQGENNSIDLKIKDRFTREWTSLGYSKDDINLFLLDLVDQNSNFIPIYTNLSSISNLVFRADEIDCKHLLEIACEQIFHRETDINRFKYTKTLKSLLDFVDNTYYYCNIINNLSDDDKKNIDYTYRPPLIKCHTKEISTDNYLPIWEQDDVALSHLFNQTSDIITKYIPQLQKINGLNKFEEYSYPQQKESIENHRILQSILFNYLAVHYLSSSPLEQKALEDFFQTIKTAGFQPLEERDSLPKGLTNALKDRSDDFLTLEKAYENIFEQKLLKPKEYSFPKAEEAKNLPSLRHTNRKGDILKEWLGELSFYPDFTTEKKIEYIEAALEGVDEGFVNKRVEYLRILVQKAVNQEDFDKINFDNEDKEIKEALTNLGLDSESLFHQAETSATQKILQDQINIIAVNLSENENENETLRLLEAVMANKQIQIESWDLKSILAIILNRDGLFSILNEKKLTLSTDGYSIQVQKITDLKRFSQLPLIQNFKNKIPNQSFPNWSDFQSGLNNIFKEYSNLVIKGEDQRYGHDIPKDLFSDNLVEVIFWAPMRTELKRLLTEETIQISDYPKIRDLLDNYFPMSSQKNELIRIIDFNYIQNKEISIKDKIEFFGKNEKKLGFDGAILIAEQITTLADWNMFFEKSGSLYKEYLSGEKEASGALAIDWFSTQLISRKKDFIIQTVTSDKKLAKSISTQLANEWLAAYADKDSDVVKGSFVRFDSSTNKFIVSKEGRESFISYKDVIDELKNLPTEKKQAILIKALTDTDGLLLSSEGKTILQTRLTESLGLKTGFFYEALGAVIQNEDDEYDEDDKNNKNNEYTGLVGATTASMLTPFLFRALSTELVKDNNKSFIKNETDKTVNLYQLNTYPIPIEELLGEDPTPILTGVDDKDLFQILNSPTPNLCLFGQIYQSQPDSELSREAQKSNQDYRDILDKLTQQIKSENEKINNPDKEAPLALEALIKAGELSPLFTRAMQVMTQILNLDPATTDRLSQTQDSTKGMEKIRFWYNLQLRAEANPEFKKFLEDDLASLDNYLGGGSLFTTYGATTTIKEGEKEGEKIVIKMLNPNAGYKVKSFHELSLNALEKMSQNPTSKTISRDVKFAKSLLSVAEEWCLKDIDDQDYSQRDDNFRLIIDDFNQKNQSIDIVEAPARKDHFADESGAAHVKIEALQKGVTLNKFLGKTNTTSDEKKQQRDSVETLLKFFDHQFDFSPTKDGNYIFHSDPHPGNYMIDTNPSVEGIKLGVIDRSMYLVLNKSEVETFRLLKNNRGKEFIGKLIDLCLEKNEEIGDQEKSSLKQKIKGQLTREGLRQFFNGENNAIGYLQTVLQEFASNPQEIKMPVEYWLMIRNITAMKNLKKKWLN